MASYIARRRFLATLLGGAAAAWPLAAGAQQAAPPVIGFVNAGSLDTPLATAFRKGLNEAGYVEGQNVTVEYLWLEGKFDRLPAVMADLVRRRVAVIATPAFRAGVQAAKAATSTIPIVFGVGDDPVKLGLVASLARPGGNATGVNSFNTEVVTKRIGLLHDLLPKSVRIVVLVNPANAPIAEATLREVPEAARALGLQIRVLNASTSREIEAAFASLGSRRNFLHLAAGAAALPAVTRTAWAQAYPSRPVRIIVGYAAGGGTDISARVIGQWLSERLGQQFIIENRPGAATNIATEAVARAAADGYTLLLATAANAINATYYDKLNFDFIQDIAPVATVMRVPLVMVINPSFPIKSVPELIAHAKANPRKISYASGGAGGPDHMAAEYFKLVTETEMLHVPYRGLGPALTDLIGGQVQLIFATMPAAIEYIKASRLRALAVTTASRSEALPDVPIVADVLPGFEASQWYALCAPKKTPADIVATINQTVLAALADPKMKTRIAELGGVPMPMTPAEFGKFTADETEKWAKVIKFSGIKAE